MRGLSFVAGLLFLVVTAVAEEPRPVSDSANPPRTSLWKGRAPIGDGSFESADAWITVHKPAKPIGTAIIICPGGSYRTKVIGPEGHGIAAWLNQHGITGVVLDYRLPAGRSQVPLLDAQQAIRTVRAHAGDWSLDPGRIGIMGFSAGGHLAATAGTHFDTGNDSSPNAVERSSSRPDFMILVYPVITLGELANPGLRTNLLGEKPSPELIERFSNEKQVTDQTPPTFAAHAVDDKPVPPEHSRMFCQALRDHQVPSKYLELPSGGHGLNGYQGPMWDAWQAQSLAWLKEQKLTP